MKKTNESNTLFKDFQKNIKAQTETSQKTKLVDQLMIDVKKPGGYPVFESDSTVVLLHRTAEDSVFINGDMTYWSDVKPFLKVEGTDLFFFRDTLPADARLEYWLTYGAGEFGQTDPLNPYKVGSGFGPMSELAMPEYSRHPLFKPFAGGESGDTSLVDELYLDSQILDYDHQLFVYLPDEYKNLERRFPVVYFKDGLDYIEFAYTPRVLDWLIEQDKIKPVIAVFITPPNRFKPEMPNRMTEYGLNDDYVAFICDELVPHIDSKYRTKPQPDSRLVVGDSFGGLISAYIPFSRPAVFGLGYSQSGYLSFRDDQLIRAYSKSEKKPIRLFVDVGTFERNVGAGMLPAEETDFLLANRNFERILAEKGYEYVYNEYNEGHTWGNWRRHLMDGLVWFAGEKE